MRFQYKNTLFGDLKRSNSITPVFQTGSTVIGFRPDVLSSEATEVRSSIMRLMPHRSNPMRRFLFSRD